MAKKETSGIRRMEIYPFFEGINGIISDSLAKKGEMTVALNARSTTIGSIEKRSGTKVLGNEITATKNLAIFFFNEPVDAAANLGMYRVSTVSTVTSVYYLNNSENWIALINKGTSLTALPFSYTFSKKCCFLVNGTDNNRYISENGTTVIDSTTNTGHLYGSPKAKKIKYFKDRLYLADYTVGSDRKKDSVMMSSLPVGIVSLVDGDHDAGVTTIKITDVKYVNTTDSLDVYRGNSKIETLTVTAKTEDEITVNATGNAINSSDELWVANTFNADKVFRWANNEAGGVNLKEYDSFSLGGNLDSRIKLFETIGNVLMIGTNDNLAVWDNYRLQSFNLGIGCVSDNGSVKSLGSLFFIGYDGIFQTSGGQPKLISAKVEKYIEGASKAGLEAAAMGKKGYSIFCAIGDVDLYNADGSDDMTLSDVVLEMNLRSQSWTVHTGIKATEFCTFVEATDPRSLQFASTETKYPIMEFLTGEDDNGDEIPFRIDSSNISLSKEFEKISYVYEVIIESERGSNIQCFVSLDREPFYEIEGTARKGATVLKVTGKDGDKAKPPRCRTIKISIRDFSKQICKISRVALTSASSNEEEQHRE